MYVSFTKETESGGTTTVVSGDKYRVIDIHYGDDEQETSPYIIHLEKPIGINDDFVVQDAGYATNGISLSADGIHVLFWQKSVTNKPEFDGRFFVKILSDQATEKHLSRAKETFNSWRSTDLDIYKIQDDGLTANTYNDYDWSNASLINVPATIFVPDDSDYGLLNGATEWYNALKFGGSQPRAAWFIDNASFAGEFISGDTYKTSFSTGSINYDSCDLVSTLPAFSYSNGQSPAVPYSTMASFLSGALVTGTSTAPVYNVGTGLSLGRLGMKGIHTKNSKNYIDLSYSILNPEIALKEGGLAWDVGGVNTSTDDQRAVVGRLIVGSRFKLKGGRGIFKILSVAKYRLLNYIGVPSILEGGNQVEMPWTQTNGPTGGSYNLVQHGDQTHALEARYNKRATYRIKYELDETASPSGLSTSTTLANDEDIGGNDVVNSITATTSGTIQFLEEFNYEGENKISSNPAVFETEPKEDVGLDLYYEASSSLPVFPLTNKNKHLFIPIGTTIVPPFNTPFPSGVFITGWSDITLNSTLYINLSAPITEVEYAQLSVNNGYVEFLRDDGTYVTATIPAAADVTFYGSWPATTTQLQITPNNQFGLSWHNCWSFNNGVESNRIGDTFNKPYLSNGATLSTTVKDSPGQENRKYGLIYSGIYNSNSGVNSFKSIYCR
jgi:hypothetical protein